MKILFVHSDYIKFKPLKKALKQPEELSEKRKLEIEVKNPLVAFTAIEKQDETNPGIVEKYVNEIMDVAKKVHAENIVIYPYAHLSSSLSSPDFALKIFEQADKKLSLNFKVTRAPFGYYKEFELKGKGHPLSELSREISNKEIKKHSEDINHLLREISKSKLDTRKLKDNDHRILGQQMNLFSFSDIAPGMVFWHNNGLIIFNELKKFMTDILKRFDYQEIATPQILDGKLFKVSGHWEHYKENMFLTNYENRDFVVKPMNCPGSMLVYRTKIRSYKDLPLRLAEFGIDHRKELSGVLAGLFRLVQFTQDDAHVFCTKEQIGREIENILEIIKIVFKDTFNFDYSLELSTRPLKFMGNKKDWDYSEKILENILKKSKVKYIIKKGDGAFYGPKIDLHVKDSLKRTWQLSTIQLDMQMPERFQLKYIDKNNKEKTPFVIHRAIFGAIERFIGILLEHTNGHLPLWLASIQVRVINFTDRNNKSCNELLQQLKAKNVRTDADLGNEPLQGKIKQAEMEKIPYIIVIGDKEEKDNSLAVRSKGEISSIRRDEFIEKVRKDIEEKAN